MNPYLKVKIKSLAAEAGIIRREERKLISWKPRTSREERRQRAGTIRWMRDHQAPPAEIEAAQATYLSLHLHRTRVVRQEARAAQLAYGYLRQTPFRVMEKAGSSKPPIEAVKRLVMKYGAVPTPGDAVDAWFKA